MNREQQGGRAGGRFLLPRRQPPGRGLRGGGRPSAAAGALVLVPQGRAARAASARGGGGWGEKPKHILGFGSNMCWLHGLPIGGGITRAVSRSCFSARLDLHRRRVGIEISAVNVKQKASPHLLRALAGFRGFSSLPGDAVFVLVCLKGYKMGSQCNYKRHKVV